MKAAKLVRLRALADFTHKGDQHREGAALIVPEGEAARLIEFGLARLETNARVTTAGPWARPTLR